MFKFYKFLLFIFLLSNFEINAQNPVLVKDIAPFYGSQPSDFSVLGNSFLFSASGYNGGSLSNRELYISDGTLNGTQLLYDINPGTGSSSPEKLIVIGNKVYFVISDNSSGLLVYRPWVSDGTVGGTFPLLPNATTFYGHTMVLPLIYNPAQLFVEYNNEVYFIALKDSAPNNRVIFKTDGTVGGTQLAIELPNSTGLSNSLNGILVFNDSLYFSGTSNGGAFENLYKSGGNNASTYLVKNNVVMYGFSGGATYNNRLYFSGTDLSGVSADEPWVTDGTSLGTYELQNLQPLSTFGSNPKSFRKINDKLVFLASPSGSNAELFVSDSLNANSCVSLGEVSNIGLAYNSNWFYEFNGNLYFRGSDANNGYELWKTDGTQTGTGMLIDIAPGSSGSSPHSFTEYCNELYFTAINPVSGASQALYKTDGSIIGTSLVPGTIANPTGGAGITSKVVFNNNLYFSGQYDVNIGEELYSYSNTCATGFQDQFFNNSSIIAVYPNPFDNKLNINTNILVNNFSIRIYSSLGKVVFEGNNINEIETKYMISGLYLIEVITENGKYTSKIMKN